MTRVLIAMIVRLFCGAQGRWVTAPYASPEKPCVYFANHTSHFDSVLVWAALEHEHRETLRIVAAREYWERGPIRRWLACRVFRAVLIDRDRQSKANHLPTVVSECIQGGSSVLLFPEGGRQSSDETGEFRPGLWHIARANPDTELIPVWIENLGRVLPKGEILPIPILSAVTFGPPIRQLQDEDKAGFLRRAREAVLALSRKER